MKIGEIVFKDIRCTLWNGDCLEVMREIPGSSVDMILCDLPYGTTKCSWDTILPFDELWIQYDRIAKENCAIVLFGNEPFSSKLRLSNIKQYKYDMYMRKSQAVGFFNAKRMPLKDIETISVFYKKLPTYNPQGVTYCNKVMHNSRNRRTKGAAISSQNGGLIENAEYIQQVENYPRQVIDVSSTGKTVHPTQKPVTILEYLIRTYTNDGDLVLDNCMGSGSTGVAALNTNRRFLGIELDPTYSSIATDRIQHVVCQYL